MKMLEDKMRDRHNDLIGVRLELEEVTKDLKDSKRLLETSNKRAEEAERKIDELKKEVEAQAQVQPPVANIEEPGPCRKVEEAESEDPTVESTLLQTTGGVYGDTEGDETFTMPAPPPSPRGKERGQVRRRGGEVARVCLVTVLMMGTS